MNEFIVQAKSATIASLSMVETHGAPENLSPTARSHDPPHAMACPRSRIVVTGQYGDDALRHGDRRHDG